MKDLEMQLQTKNDEIRILIERMEQYRKHKDAEVAKAVGQKKQIEEEIKVMIREHERQKREAGEKLKMLNEMFTK